MSLTKEEERRVTALQLAIDACKSQHSALLYRDEIKDLADEFLQYITKTKGETK